MGNLAEHQMLGNSVRLKGPGGDEVKSLPLENGLDLRFGDILGVAGDFFGPKSTGMIAAGDSEDDRETLFLSAFNCLAKDEGCESFVNELLKDADIERQAVEKGMAEGRKAAQVYEAGIISDNEFQWDSTFRQWSILTYLGLAAVNIDHFGDSAVASYTAGHRLALKAAQQASQSKDSPDQFRNLLVRAYALEAFACHYLSDLFAAGHMRNPRKALMDVCYSTKAAGLCSYYQHREDGNLGLIVSNKQGRTWKAYGDGHWFDSHRDPDTGEDVAGRTIIIETLQAAADSLFDVASGAPVPATPVALDYVPSVVPGRNHSPLFRIQAGTENADPPVVEKRKDINDPAATDYVSDWLAADTVWQLYQSDVGALGNVSR